jgi:hypothetical protein
MYHGWRDITGTAHVKVDLKPLNLRLDLANHSPTGFEWGYGGSGPAQLALAMLADVIGDDEVALRLHQKFKWKVISRLSDEHWFMDADLVRAIAADLMAENPA